ncbi:31918_t:CDS:10 [Gigaspora margarita]|uniref:Transmembrane 9 superfamily member n=1 Tax=Gigaspora margarita TaxID=4874 RepID=A0ABM8W0A6_GIGMA|nr:31918_t:CDS:10 [Gigaspora margarita]
MKRIKVWAAMLLLFYAVSALADEHSHTYESEEDVIIWVNTVGPKSNRQETYEYFQLPYCQGDHVSEHHHETLGEALLGMELVNSGIGMRFLINEENVTICDKGLTAKDVNLFRYAVSNNYWYQLFLDELPVWGFVGEFDSNTGDAYLYTHRIFVISYNHDKIIQVKLESGNPVKLYWETQDIPVRFSYSVRWEFTEDPFDSRFDKLLDTEFFEHKRHIVAYAKKGLRQDHDLGDEYGWKQVHGDVFRAPRSLLLFSALVGTGHQLMWLTLVMILYIIIGDLYAERATILTASIFFYTLTSVIAGYSSANTYQIYGGIGLDISLRDEVLDEILELVDDEDNERLNSLLPEPSNSNEYAQEKRSSRISNQKRKKRHLEIKLSTRFLLPLQILVKMPQQWNIGRSTTSPRRGGYSEEDGEGNDRRRDTDEFDSELYHDEDDRDRLENLVELDRERILAERAEKVSISDLLHLNIQNFGLTFYHFWLQIQHHKDLEAVQLMINLEDVSSTRRSSRTKDTKKKGDLEELKRRRAQKNQSQRTKAGSQSPEPGEHVTTGDEDDMSYEEDENGERNKDDDSEDITLDDIRDIQLTRHQFSDWVYKPFFEKIVVGCFVRLHIGLQNGVEVPERVQPYLIDANDKVKTNKVLRLKHADAVKCWQMNIISNGKFEQSEFDRWTVTMKIKKFDLPTKEAIMKKKDQIKFADEYILSEQDVDIMIKQKQTLRGGIEPLNLLTEKTTLVTQKDLAVAQGNYKDVQTYTLRLAEIDRMLSETSRPPKQDTWARVNERNRLKNLEDSRRAEEEARKSKKEFIPRKSIKTSITDSPTSKINGVRAEQFEKARKSSLTPYEALINEVQCNLVLPPDPDNKGIREEFYASRYSAFTIEQSLELIRKIVKQSSQTQQQSDVPQQQQPQLPPREESKNIQPYTTQPPHSSWNSDGAIPLLRDLHYEI